MKRRTFVAAAAALLAAPALGRAQGAAGRLKVGVSAGPYGDILREAAKLSRAEGLEVEIVEFTDWNLPNAALHAGDIDLNNFQHRPYLWAQVKARNYKIVALDPSIVVPAGLYSSKVARLEDIPSGGRIAIPNDPSNAARALFLIQEAGLIKLKPGADVNATVLDVADNPRRLAFVELDAAQLARALDDVSAAFVTNNYAFLAGLDQKKALKLEGADSLWTLVFAAREDRKDDPLIRRYIGHYRSAPVKAFIEAKFAGTILPTW